VKSTPEACAPILANQDAGVSCCAMGTLNLDRYHAAMGDASYKDVTRVHASRSAI
jgi:hypothetical protein